MSNKLTAIIIATIALLILLALAFFLQISSAEMSCQECETTVNSIFEADQDNKLEPPLTQMQILELSNVCDSQLTTLDDIKEIAPQYWNAVVAFRFWDEHTDDIRR